MNEDILQGKWTQLKGKAKEQWGKLTDDDIEKLDGKKDQLIGRIQERYGMARDQAERDVNAWLKDTAGNY
ncbi:MAG: PqqD family peptide modification chaperone [Vicinamibacterales bacterium]|jgi:uncharacterized protein YjbJ (UPF0337 family)